MRRIKSAPANLASMSHNKKIKDDKLTTSILVKKEYPLNIYYKNNKIDKNNIIPLDNYKNQKTIRNIKNIKNKFIDLGDYLSDITNDIDNIPVEETTIISAIILYVSQNILKREKLKEFNNFLLKIIFKYIIMYYFHVYILQDDTYYLFHVSDILNNLCITNYCHLNEATDTVYEKKLIDKPSIINLSKLHNNINNNNI